MQYLKQNAICLLAILVTGAFGYLIYTGLGEAERATTANQTTLGSVKTTVEDNNKRIQDLEKDAEDIQKDIDDLKATWRQGVPAR